MRPWRNGGRGGTGTFWESGAEGLHGPAEESRARATGTTPDRRPPVPAPGAAVPATRRSAGCCDLARGPRFSDGRTALAPPPRRVGPKSSPGLGPVPQLPGKRAQRAFRAGPLTPRRRWVAREGRWPRTPGAGRFSPQQVREFVTRAVGLS